MTEILFYSGVPDTVAFSAALLVKAQQKKQRLMLWVDDAAAAQALDLALWTYDAHSFVPHGLADDPAASDAPLLIGHTALDTEHKALPHHDVLVNLAIEPPAVFSRFERLVELIAPDEASKERGRVRFMYYRNRGYTLVHHDLSKRQSV